MQIRMPFSFVAL